MFLDKLILTPDGNKWRTVGKLRYRTTQGGLVEVPSDFVTDLASIPRLLRPIFPIHGKHTPAAVMHDFLYATCAVGSRSITRKYADDLFLEAMLILGTNRFKAISMYSAVRLGGWLFFTSAKGKK